MMTHAELDRIRNWFATYACQFAAADGSLPLPLQVKVDHSRRVADEARDMARELQWPETDLRVAEAVGLLHDVGRFTQYTRFRTFRDLDSINHGAHGAEVLAGSDLASAWPDALREVLLASVRHHNAHQVPVEMASPAKAFLHLVRDADKLDIYQVVLHALQTNEFDQHPEITLSIRREGPVTPELLDEIRRGQPGSYRHLKTVSDLVLVMQSWVFCINYTPALRRIAERRFLEDLSAFLPADRAAREVAQAVRDFVARRLDQEV